MELARFVVNEDGTIGDIEILKSVDLYCDAEIIRIIKLLPNFTPGQQDGKPVKVWYTLPVTFNM
ncbi:MAG: energy transducer TonB [Bacteroidaceae bacterium]|nr:energy transducer TonB [Bacteroidaceae bacterium]MBR3734049.1 energy transducer TonB [Bacteroidaceae bacterium]